MAIIDDEDVAIAYEMMLHEGYSLRQVGDEFGVTGEGIRQRFILLYGPDAMKKILAARRERQKDRASERQLQELQRRAEFAVRHNLKCALCTCWVLRRRVSVSEELLKGEHVHVTCSAECARAWQTLRYQVCNECFKQHRLRVARWAATHTTGRKQQRAFEVALGAPVQGYEQAPIPGSRNYELLKRFRPDILAKRPLPSEVRRDAMWDAPKGQHTTMLSSRQKKILGLLTVRPMTNIELQAALGIDGHAVWETMYKLEKRGIVTSRDIVRPTGENGLRRRVKEYATAVEVTFQDA